MGGEHKQPAYESSAQAERPSAPAKHRPARRRRRRWVRVLLVAGVLLIILVLAAPYILSTGIGTALAVGVINTWIEGNAQLDGMSLSWLGPIQLTGLSVSDPDGREVLRIQNITIDTGVLGAVFSWEHFGRVHVSSPRAVLYLDEEGPVSLARAFRSRKPPGKPGRLPEPEGSIVVQAAAVRVVRADGRTYEVTQIDAELGLRTLGEISGSLSVALPGGGRVHNEIAIYRLVSDGKVSPAKASGNVRSVTKADLHLGPLGAFALGQGGMGGKAGWSLDLEFEPGKVGGGLAIDVKGLRAAYLEGPEARPVDLHLSGRLGGTRELLEGRLKLGGQIGQIQAGFEYAPREDASAGRFTAAELLSAALAGESISLPKFKLAVDGAVDLAALSQAVPALLKVRRDVEITAGRVRFENLAVSGGARPIARGKLELTGLTALRGGRAIRWNPVVADFSVLGKSERGVMVERAELRSDFAGFFAKGPLTRLRGRFQADLTRLHRQLGQVIELGAFELAGKVQGRLDLTRAGDRVDVDAAAASDGFRYAVGRQELSIRRATVSHKGYATIADGKVRKLVVTEASADIDGAFVVAGSGWLDRQNKTFHADVELRRGDLTYASRQAKAWKLSRLTGYAGALSMKMRADRASAGGPIVSSGSGRVSDLRLDGEPVGDEDTTFTFNWSDAKFTPDRKLLTVAAARLESALAKVAAEDVRCRLGEEISLDVQIKEFSADLGRCLAAAKPFARWDKIPPLTGQLNWSGSARTAGTTAAFAGRGYIADFRCRTGKADFRQERVSFEHDAEVDWRAEDISLRKFQIDSPALSTRLAGRVRKYRTQRSLDLSGRYEASWEHLMPLLRVFVPETADVLALAGKTGGEIKLSGTGNRPEVRPVYRGVDASLDVGWASATAYGVQLGEALFSPALRDGRVSLPVTAISAKGGKVRVGGVVDLRSGEPVLRMAGRTRVLEDVQINAELGKHLLSRINPVFSELDLGRAEGKISLLVEDLVLPLGDKLRRGGAGRGHLDLTAMKIVPRGVLGLLLRLGGLDAGKTQAVKVSGVDFVISNGRINYDSFAMVFADTLELRFHGWVGFDDELDMVVSVPVRAALLKRFGVAGPLAEYARLLEGARVDVPLVGSRLKPKLDLSKLNLKPLIQRAIRALLAEQAAKRVGDILSPKEPARPASRPATKPAAKTPEERLLDSLFKLLEDRLDQPKRD